MKSALILGATSDIGKACIEQFAANDYYLYLAGRDYLKLLAVQKDLSTRQNMKSQLLEINLIEHQAFSEAIRSIPGNLDVVLCAIGTLGNHPGALENSAEALEIIDSNFRSIVPLLQLSANRLKDQKKGKLIVITSVAGLRGRASNYFYGSAKAGMIAILSGLRNAMHPYAVQVTTVIPGYVNTRMTAHMNLPTLLTSSPKHLAKAIYRYTVVGKRNILYWKPIWRYIMLFIRIMPESIFKRINW